jgi:hypothetical protein
MNSSFQKAPKMINFFVIIGVFAFVAVASVVIMDFQDYMTGKWYQRSLEFNAICVFRITYMGTLVAIIAKIFEYLDRKVNNWKPSIKTN